MTFEIHTGGQAMELQLNLEAKIPCVLSIIGKDDSMPYSRYFNRGYGYRMENMTDKLFLGKRSLRIPMPLSPEKLTLIIKNDVDFHNVTLTQLNAFPIETTDLWLTDSEREFIDFAIRLSREAGSFEGNKVIKSESDRYIALYLPVLKNRENGSVLSTPARINRNTGIIEIAERKFKSYSIYMRLVILFHEFFHWNLDTRSEQEADFHAIDWALSIGLPQTEVMYAFTKVFPSNNEVLTQREKDNIEYIRNWQALKKS